MKIINVVIAYKNIKDVYQYALLLSKQNVSNEIGLVIVINDSKTHIYTALEEKILSINLHIDIFYAEKNLGYFNGFIFGVNEFIKKYRDDNINWYILSNTDIEYANRDFFAGFIKEKYDKETWCVGPSIYKASTKTYQNPEALERRSARKMKFLSFIFSNKYIARLYIFMSNLRRSQSAKYKPKSQYVYEIHGAFFALRKEFTDIIREKSYGAFLYSEETYVAEELLKINKKTFYDSEIEIIHHEHSVTNGLSNAKRIQYIAESLMYLTDAYFSK